MSIRYEIWSKFATSKAECLGIRYNYTSAVTEAERFSIAGHRDVEVFSYFTDYEADDELLLDRVSVMNDDPL